MRTLFYSVGFLNLLSGDEPVSLFKKCGITKNFTKRLGDYQTWANKHKLQMVCYVDECFGFETKAEALEFEGQFFEDLSFPIHAPMYVPTGFPNPTECVACEEEVVMPSNALKYNFDYDLYHDSEEYKELIWSE